jgi:hypothetical protein
MQTARDVLRGDEMAVMRRIERPTEKAQSRHATVVPPLTSRLSSVFPRSA